MTTYKLTHEGYVIRDGDTKVPITDTPEFPNTNPDYLEYLQWLADGGVPQPADPVVLTPQEAQTQIDALERQYLMPRIARETFIFQAEERALEMGLTLEYLRAKNKGYAGLKALDEQIAALRALIT